MSNLFHFFIPVVRAQEEVVVDPGLAVGEILKPTPNTALELVPRIGSEANPLYGFISWGLTFITIFAGLYTLVNLLIAGASLVASNGDSGATQKVRQSITNSLLGLGIIVLAYAITAIASTLIFGDPMYYINPQILAP